MTASPLSQPDHAAVADRIVDYHERLSICAETGVPEPEAIAIAAGEVGNSIEELAELQVSIWKARIEELPEPVELARLRRGVLRQISEPWMLRAAMLGWDDVGLFGVHPVAPVVRIECWGAAVAVALSPHNRVGRDGVWRLSKLVEIDANRALIELPSSVRTVAGRFPGLGAMPLWEVPVFASPRMAGEVAV